MPAATPSETPQSRFRKYVTEARRRIELLIRDTKDLLPRREEAAAASLDHLRDLAFHAESLMDSYLGLGAKEMKEQASGFSPAKNPVSYKQPIKHGLSSRSGKVSPLRKIAECAATVFNLSCLVVLDMIRQNVLVHDKLPSSNLTGADWLDQGESEAATTGAEDATQRLVELVRMLVHDAASGSYLPDARRDDEGEEEEESVVPAIALMGNTRTTATIASLAYSHSLVLGYFDMKDWIVAPPDFDLVRLTRDTVDSFRFSQRLPEKEKKEKEKEPSFFRATGQLDATQILLMEAVQGKKFLLVMEGILNHNYEDWDRFQSPLTCGARGSKILFTTPDRRVSKVPRVVSFLSLLQTAKAEAAGNQKVTESPGRSSWSSNAMETEARRINRTTAKKYAAASRAQPPALAAKAVAPTDQLTESELNRNISSFIRNVIWHFDILSKQRLWDWD